jgi:Zn-dependent protease
MSFRLFGVNVEIQVFFWITTVLLAMRHLSDPSALAIWVAVVLVSVLVHEYGHAFAVKRHGIEPEIALHGMGGTTSWRQLLPLRRRDLVVISLAGPFAGFAFGGLTELAIYVVNLQHWRMPPLAAFAVLQLRWVNFTWGLVNLAPVLPFDGGHVLEQILGPKRERLTAIISTAVGFAVAVFFVSQRSLWGALLFGMAAMRSYQRFSGGTSPSLFDGVGGRTAPAPRGVDLVPPELAALLRSARHALANEQLDRAMALAQQVLDGDGGTIAAPPQAIFEALEVFAWAHLLGGRPDLAAEVLGQARRIAEPDPALSGAVLMAQKNLGKAREVLEAARAKGDDRKEVVGPLIQILIEQEEVARAAAVAFDIVDSLSDDDARRMAQIAYEHRSFDWSARLYEAVFDRHKSPDDAYDAARAQAQDGQPERALDLLRRAVEAGFSDRARAWSDAALETLRAGRGLETLLPRP